jgi:hypothetical protein
MTLRHIRRGLYLLAFYHTIYSTRLNKYYYTALLTLIKRQLNLSQIRVGDISGWRIATDSPLSNVALRLLRRLSNKLYWSLGLQT